MAASPLMLSLTPKANTGSVIYPAGSYSYAETAVSPGYLPDSTQRSISLDELGTVTGDIFYTGTRTSVTVISVVGDENCTTCPAIGGVGVAIVSSNGGAVVADVQYTDENGYAVFGGLSPAIIRSR